MINCDYCLARYELTKSDAENKINFCSKPCEEQVKQLAELSRGSR